MFVREHCELPPRVPAKYKCLTYGSLFILEGSSKFRPLYMLYEYGTSSAKQQRAGTGSLNLKTLDHYEFYWTSKWLDGGMYEV